MNLPAQGWQCPKCEIIWSPHVHFCSNCATSKDCSKSDTEKWVLKEKPCTGYLNQLREMDKKLTQTNEWVDNGCF